MIVKYEMPTHWIAYDLTGVQKELVEAKSAILGLRNIPYQRSWVEGLQIMELKREVVGTSRIEGADFTESELDAALSETAEELHTRSQKQVRSAVKTYRWIAEVPDGRPVDGGLIQEIHRRIVTGADDDHCAPGRLRGPDDNVTFGQPRHRGASGGPECEEAFGRFVQALQGQFPGHDPIIQALAAHYHLAAIHPFQDGNGRTARALEALMLQRAGLRDTCFIAMSNYYYEEKFAYLDTLAEARAGGHDITPFLRFALKGIASQSGRVLAEIRQQVQKAVYRNVMYDLFDRLKTPRKRVLAERQLAILRFLLDAGEADLDDLFDRFLRSYDSLKAPGKAFIRDIEGLLNLEAVEIEQLQTGDWRIWPRLEWPTEITEGDFMRRMRSLPTAKSSFTLRKR